MNKAMLSLLSEPEVLLVRDTEPTALALLDEDAAGDLLLRVRRARNKYSTNYRRQSSQRVVAKGSRGAARGSSNKTAMKAEIFEDALARVSRRLAALAKQSAADLRAERLAAARGDARTAPAKAPTKAAARKAARQAQGAGDEDEGAAHAGRQEAGGVHRAPPVRDGRRPRDESLSRVSRSVRGTGRARPARRPGRPGRRRSRRAVDRRGSPATTSGSSGREPDGRPQGVAVGAAGDEADRASVEVDRLGVPERGLGVVESEEDLLASGASRGEGGVAEEVLAVARRIGRVRPTPGCRRGRCRGRGAGSPPRSASESSACMPASRSPRSAPAAVMASKTPTA